MSTSKKPRTALAKLLDSMKDMNHLNSSAMSSDDEIIQTTSSEPLTDFPRVETESVVQESPLTLQKLDPNECQPWQFADRPEDEMGDIEQLAHSLKTVGQQEPVLARLRQETTGLGTRYEIIFGNRRWRAAKLAKIKLLAIVKPVSDQDAALYQTEENEARKDLSDFARAKSYKAQLDAGIFTSEADLSKKMSISRKTLNDIMAFIRVPEELVNVIPNYKYLSRAMVVKLALLAKDKNIIARLIELAPKIGMRAITTTNLESHLKSVKIPKHSEKLPQESIKDKHGKLLFAINVNAKGQAIIKMPPYFSDQNSTEKIKQLLYQYFTQTND